MSLLRIEFFSGYTISSAVECPKNPVVDVHVVDERGRTKKVFPSPRYGSHLTLAKRISMAEEWIRNHAGNS